MMGGGRAHGWDLIGREPHTHAASLGDRGAKECCVWMWLSVYQ